MYTKYIQVIIQIETDKTYILYYLMSVYGKAALWSEEIAFFDDRATWQWNNCSNRTCTSWTNKQTPQLHTISTDIPISTWYCYVNTCLSQDKYYFYYAIQMSITCRHGLFGIGCFSTKVAFILEEPFVVLYSEKNCLYSSLKPKRIRKVSFI